MDTGPVHKPEIAYVTKKLDSQSWESEWMIPLSVDKVSVHQPAHSITMVKKIYKEPRWMMPLCVDKGPVHELSTSKVAANLLREVTRIRRWMRVLSTGQHM